MNKKRIVNAALFVVSAVLLMTIPVSNLFFKAPRRSEGGAYIFDPAAAQQAGRNTNYIMLALFSALCIVFAWRVIAPGKPKQ